MVGRGGILICGFGLQADVENRESTYPAGPLWEDPGKSAGPSQKPTLRVIERPGFQLVTGVKLESKSGFTYGRNTQTRRR